MKGEGCGCTDLELVDEVVETKLHVVKEHMRRRVVTRKTGCCRRCGKSTTTTSIGGMTRTLAGPLG